MEKERFKNEKGQVLEGESRFSYSSFGYTVLGGVYDYNPYVILRRDDLKDHQSYLLTHRGWKAISSDEVTNLQSLQDSQLAEEYPDVWIFTEDEAYQIIKSSGVIEVR